MKLIRPVVKWGAIAAVLVAVMLFVIFHFVIPHIRHIPIADNNKTLRLRITEQRPQAETTLDEIIPFEWDDLYIFTAYTSREYIEETIGFELPEFHPMMYDDLLSVILVKDKKVVCYVCDRADNLGYQFVNCEHVHNGNKEVFEVDRKNGLLTFSWKETRR